MAERPTCARCEGRRSVIEAQRRRGIAHLVLADWLALTTHSFAAAYLALSTSTEFKSLQHMFASYTTGFLQSIGKEEPPRTQPIFCWATVAAGGNYHLSHTHPENMLSGVYYSRIPAHAGTIIFDDPRGPRWPFEGRYIHTPSAGEIVLFPSWLVHQVTPTQGDERRISWSCNVPGGWEELADVNLV